MPTFAAKFKGIDLFTIKLPKSGMTYSAVLESNLAAQWWGLTPEALRDREGEEQAELIATYRAHGQIESVLAHDQYKKNKRRFGRKRGFPEG